MANELTKVELSLNAQDTAAEAFTDVDTDTAAYVDVDGVDASKLILQVNYSGADTGAIYKVTDGAQYTGGAVGDLSIQHDTGGDTFFVGPLETARFKDSDGYINIEATTDGSTSAMSFRAILLP
jgi:hypothetical protein